LLYLGLTSKFNCDIWRKLLEAAGKGVFEGQEGKVRRRSKIANRSMRTAILCKYQLLKHGYDYKLIYLGGFTGGARYRLGEYHG